MPRKAKTPDAPKALDENGNEKHTDTAMEILSPSGTNTFMSCEYKFWLVYGPKKLREPGSPATIRGTLVHKVAEDIRDFMVSGNRATWKMEIIQAAQEAFDKRWATHKSLHKQPSEFKDQTWMMVKNFVNSIVTDMEAHIYASPHFGLKTIWGMSRPKTEVKFNSIETHGVHGTADEVIEKSEDEVFLVKQWTGPEDTTEEIIIGDLKTSKVFKIAWTDEYERQLKFYAYLYYLKNGKVPNYGVVKFLAHGKESYMRFSLADIKEIEEIVRTIQKKARSDYGNESAWKPNTDSKFCQWCWHGKIGACKAGFERWHSDSSSGAPKEASQGTVPAAK